MPFSIWVYLDSAVAVARIILRLYWQLRTSHHRRYLCFDSVATAAISIIIHQRDSLNEPDKFIIWYVIDRVRLEIGEETAYKEIVRITGVQETCENRVKGYRTDVDSDARKKIKEGSTDRLF